MLNNEFEENSIIKIFNEMDYEEEIDVKDLGDSSESGNKSSFHSFDVLKIRKGPESFDAAIEAAVKAQTQWKNSSALMRADLLHKVWKYLKESESPFNLNELNILIDYFDFYSDLTIQTEDYKSWKPVGVVLIVLSNCCPFFTLGTSVPAALAAGCSVIVSAPKRAEAISLYLEEIITKIGFPKGLFNVIIECDEMDLPVTEKINKTVFCGSHLAVQIHYMKRSSTSFNFFCPKNTAALILESCDLTAAVNKIITETWSKNSVFTVSKVVVQESIYKNFLEKLKYRMELFMNENKKSSIFKDKNTSEKINKVIFEAINAGASVEKSSIYKNEWSPTVIINYQNQDIDENVPVINVLLCRTAKEGAVLLNNCRYNLGTSIWSEISSEALEISTKLICPNIWINCHGILEAGEPLQLHGFSGDCVLGGSDGVLEFISFRLNDPEEKNLHGTGETNKDYVEKNYNTEKLKLLEIPLAAQKAFDSWQQIKDKRNYMKNLANSLRENKELSQLSETADYYAHFGNINFSSRNCTSEFLVIKRKVPLGVILLLVTTSCFDIESLFCFIIPAIIFGNAVIVVLKEENSIVKLLLKHFNNALPKNIFKVLTGINAGKYLSSDPNIQAIWLYNEATVTTEFLNTIKSHSVRSLKHIWVIPKSTLFSQHLFQKECLQNKIVWLTKTDQFP